MAILTRNQLKQINRKMLGLGAPVVIDGKGYNKLDYNKMFDFAERDYEKLTDRQVWYISVTLGRYKNTQLQEYKLDIEETIDYYKNAPKRLPKVTVLGTTKQFVQMSWKFNPQVSEALKGKLDKSFYFWKKDKEGQWVLYVAWDYLPTIIEEFKANSLDTSELEAASTKNPWTKRPEQLELSF